MESFLFVSLHPTCVYFVFVSSVTKLDLFQASAAHFELDANKIDIACGVVKSLENSTNEVAISSLANRKKKMQEKC